MYSSEYITKIAKLTLAELEKKALENKVKLLLKTKKSDEKQKYLSSSQLNLFEMTAHSLIKMIKEPVTPKKFIDTLDQGIQLFNKRTKDFYIVKDDIKLVISVPDSKIVTVIKNNKFRNWTDEQHLRDRVSVKEETVATVKRLFVKNLRKMTNLEDLAKGIDVLEELLQNTQKVNNKKKNI